VRFSAARWLGLLLQCQFLLLINGWVCPGPRSHFPVTDIHPDRGQAGTAVPTWLPRVVGVTALAHPPVWLSISRGRLHKCSVMHRVACNLGWFAILAVLGPRAGERACDVQGPVQGPVQELLLVCSVALASSVRALRSPAVLRLSDQACISILSTPIQQHLSVRVCVVTCCTGVGACYHSVALLGGVPGQIHQPSVISPKRSWTYEISRTRTSQPATPSRLAMSGPPAPNGS